MNPPYRDLPNDGPPELVDASDSPLDQWLRAVAYHAERPALHFSDDVWISFSELDEISDGIAECLQSANAPVGAIVSIRAPRGPFWPAAVLGVWKAGFAYFASVSADASSDSTIMNTIGSELLLQPALSGDLRDPPRLKRLTEQPRSTFPKGFGRYAYVMPTSGTTGTPKIVLVSSRTCHNILFGLASHTRTGTTSTALHLASFGFSSSVRQMFLPLFCGGSIVIAPELALLSGKGLQDLIARNKINHLDLTPSQIKYLLGASTLDVSGNIDTPIERLLVASEVFRPELARQCCDFFPNLDAIFHMYGKTEIGGAVAIRQLSYEDFKGNSLPLSKPFAPFDVRFRENAEGDTEMLIGGLDHDDQVLNGERLEKCGKSEPSFGSGLWHATGDRVNFVPEDMFHIVGRIDRVVKVLGRRLDLSEFEVSLSKRLGLNTLIAELIERPGSGTIVQVIYANQQQDPPVEETRVVSVCSEIAPGIPVTAKRVVEFILDRSGKVDRHSLRQIVGQNPASPETPDADRRKVLDRIWQIHTQPENNGPFADKADFFRSGGDSLSMIGFLAEVGDRLGVHVSLEVFLPNPCIGSVRDLLDARSGENHVEPSGEVLSGASLEQLQPTFFQRALWVSEKVRYSNKSPYWLVIEFRTAEKLDTARLKRSVELLLNDHDILRLGFVETDELALHLAPNTIDAQSFCFSETSQRQPLETSPLVSGGQAFPLFKLETQTERNGGSLVQVSVHHALIDRQGLSLLLEGLSTRYREQADAEPRVARASDLERLLGTLGSSKQPDVRAAKLHWSGLLSATTGSTRSRMPACYARLERSNVTLAQPELPKGVTAHSIWLAAFRRSIAMAGLPYDHIIGVDVDFRDSETADIIGPCSHSLPIVLPELRSLPDLAQHATKQLLRAARFARHPVQSVLGAGFRSTHDPMQPLFLYKVVFQSKPLPLINFGGRPAAYVKVPKGISEHDMTLHIRKSGDDYTIDGSFDANVVSTSTAEAIFSNTLRQVVRKKW